MIVDSSAESGGPGEGVRRVNTEGNNLSTKGLEEPSKLGSLGSGLSSVERDKDLLMTKSWLPLDFSMAITGKMASFVSDTLRSRSFVIDRRTEPKPAKGLREELGETEREMGIAFLLGPKGRRERSERKEGIPELAEEAGVDGE